MTSIDAHRRRLLAALGAGGAASLAGCGGGDGDGTDTPTDEGIGTPPSEDTDTPDGDGDETDTPTATPEEAEFVDGATFNMFMGQADPVLTEWTWNKNEIRDQSGQDNPGVPRAIYPLMVENLGALDLVSGEVVGVLLEDFGWDENEIYFTFRDDARWSDGAEINGADKYWEYELSKMRGYTPQGVRDEFGELRSLWDGIEYVEWDGKTWSIHSDEGNFGDFNMRGWVEGEITNRGTKEMNNDRDIYRPLVEELQDDFGDIRPGGDDNEDANDRVDAYFEDINLNVDPFDQRWTGPWVLDDVNQQEVTLVPNEHHRNSPNWSEIKINPMAEAQQVWQALQNNIVDNDPGAGFDMGFGSSTPPANVIDALPDNWQFHLFSQGDRADGLATQGQQELLGDRVFKWGIMHAMDKQRLAQITHQYAAGALEDPPGMHWTGARQVLSEDQIEGFRHYEYDTDQAEEYFQQVGMTKEGGSWLRPDGSQLTIEHLTSSSTGQYESTVQSMLQDVGIDAEITRLEGATVTDRMDNGNYQMGNDGWWAPAGFFYRAFEQSTRRQRYGLWDEEEIQNWIEEHDNVDNVDHDWVHVIENYTLEQTRDWTLTAPPIGEPDADPTEEYEVVYLDLLLGRNISDQERADAEAALSWVWNYNMPVMLMHTEFNIAFHDHEQYSAPEDDRQWAWEDSTYSLMYRGDISALDAAAEEQ